MDRFFAEEVETEDDDVCHGWAMSFNNSSSVTQLDGHHDGIHLEVDQRQLGGGLELGGLIPYSDWVTTPVHVRPVASVTYSEVSVQADPMTRISEFIVAADASCPLVPETQTSLHHGAQIMPVVINTTAIHANAANSDLALNCSSMKTFKKYLPQWHCCLVFAELYMHLDIFDVPYVKATELWVKEHALNGVQRYTTNNPEGPESSEYTIPQIPQIC